MLKKVIAMLLVISLAIGVLGGCKFFKKNEKTTSPTASADGSKTYNDAPVTTEFVGVVAGEKIYASMFNMYLYDTIVAQLRLAPTEIQNPVGGTDAENNEKLLNYLKTNGSDGVSPIQKAIDETYKNCQLFVYAYLTGKANGLKVDAAARETQFKNIDTTIDSQIQGGVSRDEFMLSQTGMNVADYKRFYDFQNIVSQYVSGEMAKVTPTEDEKKTFYETNKSDFISVTVVSILQSIIKNTETGEKLPADEILKKKQKAEELLSRITAGEDPIPVAKGYSEDPGVTENQGVYVVTKASEYVPEFKEWALKQTDVATSKPAIVETEYGFHVMVLKAIDTYETSTTIKDSVNQAIIDKTIDDKMKAESVKDQYKITDMNTNLAMTVALKLVADKFYIVTPAPSASPSTTPTSTQQP